jgi:hypothetical protein
MAPNSYNDNKVRFGGGWWQAVTRFTVEVEGAEKPSFVGDSVTRVMAPAE